MKTKNIFALAICVLVSLVFLCGPVYATLNDGLPSDGVQAGKNGLLQFTAGGYVLGFEKNGVNVSAGSRFLRIIFGGTEGVTPQAAAVPEEASKPQPFQEVRYPELWPGITLTYKQAKNAVFESIYYVLPRADVNDIQLVYNVPMEIGENGALILQFETGRMIESAPVAWQEIDGQKVPVPVAFRKTGAHEAGLETGAYNPDFPLIIDPELAWNTFLDAALEVK